MISDYTYLATSRFYYATQDDNYGWAHNIEYVPNFPFHGWFPVEVYIDEVEGQKVLSSSEEDTPFFREVSRLEVLLIINEGPP